MNRTRIILLAALMAATPLSQVMAQDRDPRGGRGDREQSRERRQISEAEALSRAYGRAGGARYVGSRGMRGSSYVFLFERDGRVFEVSVSAYD
jgi:hypothetical protein